jgi:hypothetical protein
MKISKLITLIVGANCLHVPEVPIQDLEAE